MGEVIRGRFKGKKALETPAAVDTSWTERHFAVFPVKLSDGSIAWLSWYYADYDHFPYDGVVAYRKYRQKPGGKWLHKK